MKKSWSRGLVKSRLKNGRESRSRETEVGEKIAATSPKTLLSPYLWQGHNGKKLRYSALLER